MNSTININSIIDFMTNGTGNFVAAAWLISIIFFASLIIYLAKHPQNDSKPLKAVFIIMFVGGTAMCCIFRCMELNMIKNGLLEIKSLEWVNTAPWFYTLTNQS